MTQEGAVAFVLVTGAFGGGQRIALTVARRLVEEDKRIAVLAPDEGESIAQFRSLGASCFITGGVRSFSLALIRRAVSFYKGHGITCVYTHTSPVHEVIFGTAAKLSGRHLVLHRHSKGALSSSAAIRSLQVFAWRRILRRADAVVAVSEQVANEVRRLGRRVEVVHNGVPIPLEAPVSNGVGPVTVGFIGRIDPRKRVEDFIDAAAAVPHGLGARFVVIGGGHVPTYESRCRALARRLELGDALSFEKPVGDVWAALRKLDIVVLPSDLEGHPLLLLEAMAMGRPVIVSDIPGHTETVIDGEHGLVVPVGRPELLAKAMEKLITNSELRARLGRAARARVIAEFSEDRMRSQILKVLAPFT